MKIYLVDYIGVHCGMHYYNDAFGGVLSSIPGVEVCVLSNYSYGCNGQSFFVHQYKGSRFHKICSLLKNYWSLFRFVLRNKEACFIYLSYGNLIDIPFLYIISMARNSIIDIHEAIAQNVDKKQRLKQCLKYLYSTRISSVIYHSQRTNLFLDEFGYNGIRLYVPHFKYCFSRKCDINKVRQDIRFAIEKDKINILFFGNITYEKGIDILLSAINQLDPNIQDKINVIIAGKDHDGAVYQVTPVNSSVFKMIIRHIDDDELVYLYENTNYVSLPYRKTSQSGILEMAFYFQKPVVATDIPYFRKVLEEFPSFGVLSGVDCTEYANKLTYIVGNHHKYVFFTDEDYSKYSNRKEIEQFKVEFKRWMEK